MAVVVATHVGVAVVVVSVRSVPTCMEAAADAVAAEAAAAVEATAAVAAAEAAAVAVGRQISPRSSATTAGAWVTMRVNAPQPRSAASMVRVVVVLWAQHRNLPRLGKCTPTWDCMREVVA
jgi:hypothetical protein